MEQLTHFNEQGYARMVDVTEKAITHRTAAALGIVRMSPSTMERIRTGGIKKGDVLSVAQVAGIQAAKRTWEFIPLCHPLFLTSADIRFHLQSEPCQVEILATVSCRGETGVEMEALTAVSAAALTIYDMCKAVERGMVIDDIRLLYKSGGRSGNYYASGTGKVESLRVSGQKDTLSDLFLHSQSRVCLTSQKHTELQTDTLAVTCGINWTLAPVGARFRFGDAVLELLQTESDCHSESTQDTGTMHSGNALAVVIQEGAVHSGDWIIML